MEKRKGKKKNSCSWPKLIGTQGLVRFGVDNMEILSILKIIAMPTNHIKKKIATPTNQPVSLNMNKMHVFFCDPALKTRLWY